MAEDDHAAMMAAGAPDHCVRVDIPQGTYYILDYRGGKCAYLGDKNQCTIQNAKPSICKTFPVHHHDGFIRQAPWCPIVADKRLKNDKAYNAFVAEMSEIVRERLGVITKDVYFGVLDAYHDRHNEHALKKHGATITYPPSLGD